MRTTIIWLQGLSLHGQQGSRITASVVCRVEETLQVRLITAKWRKWSKAYLSHALLWMWTLALDQHELWQHTTAPRAVPCDRGSFPKHLALSLCKCHQCKQKPYFGFKPVKLHWKKPFAARFERLPVCRLNNSSYFATHCCSLLEVVNFKTMQILLSGSLTLPADKLSIQIMSFSHKSMLPLKEPSACCPVPSCQNTPAAS